MPGLLEEVTGTIDGVNTTFAVSQAYIAGTLIVFLNGQQLKASLDNGYTETSPAAGTFDMKIPPVASAGSDDPGDVIFAFYQNTVTSVGGAQFGGIPDMQKGLNLRPKMVNGEEQ